MVAVIPNRMDNDTAFNCRLSKEHSKATSDDVLSWVGTGLWIILFLIKIFTMCYHCQQVKEQGAACGYYLHQYLIDHQYQSERREVRGILGI